jgi:hypothetical protein
MGNSLTLVICLVAVASLCLACSNKMTMTAPSSSDSRAFEGFLESSERQFSPREDLLKLTSEKFGDDKLAKISILDGHTALLAKSDGQSLLLNISDDQRTEVSATLEGSTEKPKWIYALGDKQYWALANGKLHYRAQIGAELSEIEESLQSILEDDTKSFRPVYFGKSDLIGVHKGRIFWLTVETQLKREFYLALDSASLGNLGVDKISAGGLIRGRGVWLLADDYITFVLRGSNGNFKLETRRFRGFSHGGKKILPSRLSMDLASDESGKIKISGDVILMNKSGVYLSKVADSQKK